MTITLNSIDKTLVFFSERYKSTITKTENLRLIRLIISLKKMVEPSPKGVS